MQAVDFEYDSQFLSDYNFIICEFDQSSGVSIVNPGSKISFERASRNNGRLHSLFNAKYKEPLGMTFDICKDPYVFDSDEREISGDEYRDIVRWLCRKKFLSFRFIDIDDDTRSVVYYHASFNVDLIKIADKLCGLRLSMETDSPYGYGVEEILELPFIGDISSPKSIHDDSDEIGSIYPDMSIVCKEDGDLLITNDLLKKTMVIRKCKVGEVITVKGKEQIISTSYNEHKTFANDFNYQFLPIGNTSTNRENPITVSKQCVITLRYSPIIKYTL